MTKKAAKKVTKKVSKKELGLFEKHQNLEILLVLFVSVSIVYFIFVR